MEYNVRWRGEDERFDQWIPAHSARCPDLVVAFLFRRVQMLEAALDESGIWLPPPTYEDVAIQQRREERQRQRQQYEQQQREQREQYEREQREQYEREEREEYEREQQYEQQQQHQWEQHPREEMQRGYGEGQQEESDEVVDLTMDSPPASPLPKRVRM